MNLKSDVEIIAALYSTYYWKTPGKFGRNRTYLSVCFDLPRKPYKYLSNFEAPHN